MLKILRYLPKNLLTTYLCKCLNIKRLKGYPTTILPKTRYKIEIDTDKLFTEHEVFLLRKSDLSEEDSFKRFSNGQILLEDDAISSNRVINLSINIIGGAFKQKHSIYRPKANGAKNWKGDKIRMSLYKNDYNIEKPSGNIFIKASKLHNKIIPFTVPSEANLHKEISKFEKAFGNKRIKSNEIGKDIKLLGQIKIKHVPVNLNYWHAEFEISGYDEKPIEKYKGNRKTKALVEEIITNWIKVNSEPSINGDFKKIGRLHFFKSLRYLSH
jgi:hypothetical protein